MLLPLVSVAASLLAPTPHTTQEPRETHRHGLTVRVDPRIELLTLTARLAGFAEFDMPSSSSPYAARVEAHFGPQRSHAALATLQRLRAEHGVSHDAIASLAVHLDSISTLELRAPFTAAPERLDARWDPATTTLFLAQLRDFSATTKAAAFFESERPFYAEVERRLAALLSQSRALPWFDDFFGVKAGALYVAIPGLLCGGGNYGVGVRLGPDQPEEITPVFGCWKFDSDGIPEFDADWLPLFVHELCHTYTNPFVDRFASDLQASGERIHATCAEPMRRQGYGTWRTLMYETLVRASVVRCRLSIEGEEAGARQSEEELAAHFAWVPELALLFGDYEADRALYPTFDDFMPQVIAFLDAYAADLPEVKPPTLTSSTPASDAIDVDPALATMTLTFDRPMKDGSWSIVGPPSDLPEITGALAYDAERKVLSIPIRLQPARTYRVSLNSAQHRGFASAEGIELAPVTFTFRTRPR